MSMKPWGLACLLSAILVSSLPAGAGDIAGGSGTVSSRLPDVAKPESYRLHFRPDLSKFTFQGEETVSLSLSKPESSITVNAVELKISNASISDKAGKINLPGTVTLDPAAEQAHISFSKTLSPGQYDLKIAFTGELNDKLRGFYRSTYTDDKGVKHMLATTQMEPTDARRMFPCFDEPVYKATFQISAEVDSKMAAISNAPVLSETVRKSSGKKEVVFDQTPKMSTYLVTLIIGNFEATPPSIVGGVPIRVWAVKGKARLGEYARKFAARLLPFYTSYFGVPYAAKKLDLIAIPDFEAGAMENLGAITFREKALLVDEGKSATETLQDVSSVVAHEMAHLWFGDLVTMKWWDDLWLNEAFATWMSTKAVDQLVPAWHFWDEFGLDRSMALQTDSLKSTRTIHFKVENPNQINEMFDEITYEKGAAVLRMLEKYVGEQTFQKGVARYITAHKFGNAATEDLWRSIGEAAQLPIPEMMHGWVNQPGYPMVAIEKSTDGNTTTLSQKRFYLDATTNGAGADPQVWYVPVALRDLSASGHLPTELLKTANATFSRPAGSKTLLANAGASGFYRVHYPSAMLDELAPVVQSKLSAAERLGLLSDQWSLAVSSQLPIDQYLALTASFKTESDPSVTKALIGHLYQLSSLISDEARPKFERLVQDRLGPIRDKLGWTGPANEPDLIQILRGTVMQTLGTIGQDKPTIEQARKLFSQYLTNSQSLDPDLLEAVTVIVSYNGGEDDYLKVRNLWKEAKTPEDEQRNLYCLAAFRQPELIKKTLALCVSDEVRTQDEPKILGALLKADASKALAWQFVKDNWDAIVKRFPMNMVPRIVSSASSLNTPEQEEDLRSFFASHPVPAGEHSISRMLERVHIYTAFRKDSSLAIEQWLEKWAKS